MTMLRLIPWRSVVVGALAAGLYASFGKKKVQDGRGTYLPDPSPSKQDPDELDDLHTIAVRDSMAASDPPATAMPDVHRRH